MTEASPLSRTSALRARRGLHELHLPAATLRGRRIRVSSDRRKTMNIELETRIKDTVRRFILSSIAITKLDDDDNLFESGIVNSLFAVQLMTYIEKTFSIEVGMDDLDIENFKSLNATTAFVLKKNGQRNG